MQLQYLDDLRALTAQLGPCLLVHSSETVLSSDI